MKNLAVAAMLLFVPVLRAQGVPPAVENQIPSLLETYQLLQ